MPRVTMEIGIFQLLEINNKVLKVAFIPGYYMKLH